MKNGHFGLIMSDLAYINKKLVDTYGSTLDNRPKWQVVFAKDCLERRVCQYSESGMLLLYPEVREVPKYSVWQSFYILERAVPFKSLGEVVLGDGYECFYRFMDKDENPLPANWRYVNLLCRWAETGEFLSNKKSPNDLTREEEAENEAEWKMYKEMLSGNETDIGDSLYYHEAISMSGLDGTSGANAPEKEA